MRIEGIASKDPFLDRIALNDLLIDKTVDTILGHPTVPITFRVDDQDGATGADAKTLNLGPVASMGAVAEREVSGFEFVFELFPGCRTVFLGAACRSDT